MTNVQLIAKIADVLNNGDCSEENNIVKIRALYGEYYKAQQDNEATIVDGTNQ